jgi:hypothetical protein
MSRVPGAGDLDFLAGADCLVVLALPFSLRFSLRRVADVNGPNAFDCIV